MHRDNNHHNNNHRRNNNHGPRHHGRDFHPHQQHNSGRFVHGGRAAPPELKKSDNAWKPKAPAVVDPDDDKSQTEVHVLCCVVCNIHTMKFCYNPLYLGQQMYIYKT